MKVTKYRYLAPLLSVAALILGACARQDAAPEVTSAPPPEAIAAATPPQPQPQPDADGPPLQNGVYVSLNYCPGEGGCSFQYWRAAAMMNVYEALDPASKVIATLQPGDWVEAKDGQHRYMPRRGVVQKAHDAYGYTEAGASLPVTLQPGDVIWFLDNLGEGEAEIWHQAKTLMWQEPGYHMGLQDAVAWEEPAPAPPEALAGMWMLVDVEKTGTVGWVWNGRFECMGKLAGDENCRE
jgi:hypothetical protein